MIKDLFIRNLRLFKDFQIEDLEQFNLIVGKNNCGKTTLLEAIYLLLNPANPELPHRINLFRNLKPTQKDYWKILFFDLDDTKQIYLKANFISPKEKRELIISGRYKEVDSDEEGKILDSSGQIEGTDHSHSFSLDTKGINLEFTHSKIQYKKPKKYNSSILSIEHGLNFKPAPNYEEKVGGCFLNDRNYHIDIKKRLAEANVNKKTSKIVQILKKIEPRLADLTLGPDDQIYCDIGLERYVPINVMGDGIFRIIAIVLAIMSSQTGVVLIDEIENGIHFTTQKTLWHTIFHAAMETNVQVVVSTHSYECIKAFSDTLSKEDLYNACKLFRIELNKDNQIASVDFSSKEIIASLESDWEVR